ncbi:adenylate/guanylate cyclase domain-containing protein [Paradevosia shaoguanensis]|uniref:adenylate/guanylate cyclase domain-containing protein n=1 Tax=Paradevosia shaoguanensis TaxID=1335043 RepID=UPI003642CA78
MSLANDITKNASDVYKTKWAERKGVVVPEPSAVTLGNDAVKLESATVLYADLDQSTSLVKSKKWEFAAEVYKTFLYAATRLIRTHGGSIVSYDGDRVMGIFLGSSQADDAVKCGLQINYAVKKLVQPELNKNWTTDFKIRHVVGIDVSTVRGIKTGVRGDNDLVWVGNAPNVAAKLTAESADYSTWITDRVHQKLSDSTKYGTQNGVRISMWQNWKWSKHNDDKVWSSTWWWAI